MDGLRKIKIMEKTYNTKQTTSFGQYLLSDLRKARISSTVSQIPVEDRLKEIHHADMENWKGL